MPNRTTEELDFGRLGRRHLQANFEGGDLSSDGGLMLLRQIDARTGLSRLAAKALTERRAAGRIRHRLRDVLAQRLYGLCCGYEDLNDHSTLRADLLYYDHHCYLPLYVFCGQSMLACLLRPSRIDGARHAAAVLRLLVSRLRQAWPEVRIIIRGDSGFCRQRLIRWCERAGVQYLIGLARNKRLQARVQPAEAVLARDYERTGQKQRLVSEFSYAADSWDRPRRVITRLEYGSQGINPRFIVTNIAGLDAGTLYDRLYCARGEAENRIKEAQLDLFGTRASCHRFAANQFRLLLAALAYTLMQRLRETALKGTELERASAATIRVRLLKIGAAIVRNTRRVRILLASHHPLRQVFAHAARAMAP